MLAGGLQRAGLGHQPRFGLAASARQAEKTRDPARGPRPALHRAADQREEQLVGVERLGRQSRLPHRVELAAERIGKLSAARRLDPPAHDMVIERVARRADRPQHGIAQTLAVVQLVGLGGLEQQPAHADGQHQRAVAQPQHPVIEMVGIGQAAAGGFLPGEIWPGGIGALVALGGGLAQAR